MQFIKDRHYSLNLERAILGACLIEREAFGRIYPVMEADNFYNSYHRQVYSSMKEMYVNGIPIDIFTVTDQFTRVKDIQVFGKTNVPYFLANLTNNVVASTHLEYHCYVIKTMWMDREIINLTSQPQTNGEARKRITELQERLQNIQKKVSTNDWQDMTELMVGLYQHQEDMKAKGGMGITTGFKKLDVENGGFHPGQMIVIGARPSMGKSALSGSMAIDIAKTGKKVGIISLEMSNNEITARLAAIDTQTDFTVLYRGLYKDEMETHAVYKRIGNHTSTLPIFVSDKTNVDIVSIKSKAERLKATHGLDFLIIDYLQLIDTPESGNRNRENEISRISRYTKLMAKEMNIPVMILCQLNREVTKRSGAARYPQLSDIRESGSIEQDADVVMFIHRDWMAGHPENEQGETTENQADLVIRKWRNGRNNFIIPLDFNGSRMLFTPRNNGFRPVQVDYTGDNPF